MGARERKRSAYRDVARIQAQCVAKFVDCHGHQVDVAGGATGRPGVRQPGCHNTGSWTPHRAELAYNVWKVEFRRVLFRSDRKSTRLNSSHLSISYAVF